MKKFFLFVFSLLANANFCQNSLLQNGVYVAKSDGQEIKLIIKDKQYDLSIMSGILDYKNDSIVFNNSQNKNSSFDLTYKYLQREKSDKIKVILKSYIYDFQNIYLSFYDANLNPTYKRVSDIQKENSKNFNEEISTDFAEFEINRTDFLDIVRENGYLVSELAKFKIPNNVSEIYIKVLNLKSQNFKLSGIYDKQNNELVVSEEGRSPLVFKIENPLENKENEQVKPVETKKINNWNFPGKDKIDDSKLAASPIDSASIETKKAKVDLKIENKLATAIEVNAKAKNKFLVVYYDPENINARLEFDNFIKLQNKEINYNNYSGNDSQFDLYNYYFASKTDGPWFKKNNIKLFPSVVTLNANGDVLSFANYKLLEIQHQFNNFDDFKKGLNRTNTLLMFKKSLNNISKEAEIINAFTNITKLEIPYEYIAPIEEPVVLTDVKFVPPIISEKQIPRTDIEELKGDPNSESVKEEIKESPMVTETIHEDTKLDFNIYTKVNFDKTQLNKVWDNLMTNHLNDVKPDINLVLVILNELKNIGFTKQIFNEEKILDKTNEKGFEYLFKHFDAIEDARKNSTYKVDAIHDIDLLETEIKNILNVSIALIKPETPIVTQQKIVFFYKKWLKINQVKIGLGLNHDYFELLKTVAINSNSETDYIKEYDDFFNKMFSDKTNAIEALDDLYNFKDDLSYESWSEFKNSFSTSANNIAWFVVENSKDLKSIEKAVKWSETSLKIDKNNHYYLDTLAQLYYKIGKKEKAIQTEQKAIEANKDNLNIEEYKAVLLKMKNGTY